MNSAAPTITVNGKTLFLVIWDGKVVGYMRPSARRAFLASKSN